MDEDVLVKRKYNYGKEYFVEEYNVYFNTSVSEKYNEASDALKSSRPKKKSSYAKLVAYISVSVSVMATLLLGLFSGISVKKNALEVSGTTIQYDLEITNNNNRELMLVLSNDALNYKTEQAVTSTQVVGSFTELTPETEYKLAVVDVTDSSYTEVYYEMVSTTTKD